MSQCAVDGRWCCGVLTSEVCCRKNNRIYLAPKVGASSSASTTLIKSTSFTTSRGTHSQSTITLDVTPVSSSNPSSTSTSIPTSIPTSSPPNSQTGKFAGIGVGSGIGVLGMGIVVMWLVLRRQRRRAGEIHDQRPVETRDVAYGWNPVELGHATREIGGVSVYEIDGVSRHEMGGKSLHDRHNTHVRQNTL